MKKYEMTSETKIVNGVTLYRIKALISFGDIHEGDIGGFIEKEENLSHDGNAWVYGDARVYGNSRVYGNGRVYGDACVYGNAWVCGNACVYDNADYLCFKGLGSENRNATFFKCKDGHIHVSCGCFSGNIEEFENKVKETHGDNKYAKEYLACIQVVKIHFEIDD